MRTALVAAAVLLLGVGGLDAQQGRTILFVGNSFTFGSGSAVRYWQANTVTDLNDEGTGGVPALFESFTEQVGLDYDVYLETRGGSGFEFHLAEKSAELRWLFSEIALVHAQNRVLIRQELSFLDHLIRVLSGTPQSGYSPFGDAPPAPRVPTVVDARA